MKYTKCYKPTHFISLKVIQKYTYGKKSLSSEYMETLYKLQNSIQGQLINKSMRLKDFKCSIKII